MHPLPLPILYTLSLWRHPLQSVSADRFGSHVEPRSWSYTPHVEERAGCSRSRSGSNAFRRIYDPLSSKYLLSWICNTIWIFSFYFNSFYYLFYFRFYRAAVPSSPATTEASTSMLWTPLSGSGTGAYVKVLFVCANNGYPMKCRVISSWSADTDVPRMFSGLYERHDCSPVRVMTVSCTFEQTHLGTPSTAMVVLTSRES